uniref:Uncharacterized protein n=1 Tax=Seriola lalandi dorsalis TaxID=1841481 RepID=A0A3B4WAP7_SERLL
MCVSGEDYEPSYYRLTEENTTFCLATGFSRYNALSSKTDSLNWSQVVRISGDSLYNSVVLGRSAPGLCRATEERFVLSPTEASERLELGLFGGLMLVMLLFPGPTVNTVSLIVLGLRLLFIKTVIFNFLMTLRLWISQCESESTSLSDIVDSYISLY